MTIVACIGATTKKQARSTRGTWRTSWTARAPRDGASQRTSPKLCQVLEGRLFFRRDISGKFTGTCARQGQCASRMKCRSASGAWGRTSGDSKRKVWCRTFGSGKTDRERVSAGRGGHHEGNRGFVCKRDGIFQHLWRQSSGVRGG